MFGAVLPRAAGAAAVNVVANGRAAAVVVIPDEPSRATQYAAKELVEHVKKATGVTLVVTNESNTPDDPLDDMLRCIYLGPTRAAKSLGIDADKLDPEVFVMRSSSGNLYIVGNESEDENPTSFDARYVGTLFGVYEFLERYVNVRWLWPGELGTYIPTTDTVAIEQSINQTVEPKFVWRHMRSGLVDDEARRDVFTYQRRHRMTSRKPKPSVGHYFTGWWKKYGEAHPEWFAMNQEGERVGTTMCVSNTELHRKVVEVQGGNRASRIRAGEVDGRRHCACEQCKAWDEPKPGSVPRFARGVYNPMTSNRYARFWSSVRDVAIEQNPDALVTTFIYFNYTAAPTADVKLHNVYADFVQSGDTGFQTFPVTNEAMQWLKQQWAGWRRTGISMGYRPNILLGGYAMPYLSTHQTGEFFQFAWENGAMGTDFDSLVPMWSVRGPELYLLHRLHVKPDKPVQQILDEYYSAFGPAADAVRAYFNYWEKHAIDMVNAGKWSHWDRVWRHYIKTAHHAFPLESYEPAERILTVAAQVAARSDRPEYAQRVEFLRLGLEHAKLCTQLSAVYDGDAQWGDIKLEPGTEQFAEAKKIYEQIRAFRDAHKVDHVVSVKWLEGYCERFWNLSDLIAE